MSARPTLSRRAVLAGIVRCAPLQYGTSACCWIVFHSLPLVPGLIAKALFDDLEAPSPSISALALITALIVGAGLAKATVILVAALSGSSFGFRVRAMLQHNMLSGVLARPGAQALDVPSGQALSTLRDDIGPILLIGDLMFDSLSGLILASGALIIMLSVDSRVTLLVLPPVAIVIAIAQLVRRRLTHLRVRSRQATAELTGALADAFSAIRTIQAAGAQAAVVGHVRRLCAERRRAVLRDRLQGLALDAVFAGTGSLGVGLTLLVAAADMRRGTFSVGDLALFATYLFQISSYTGFLGYLIDTYRQSSISVARMVALVRGSDPLMLLRPVPLDVPHRPSKSPGSVAEEALRVLEVRSLTVRHPGSERGLEDVGLTLRRGTVTVITGPVGAGKTTLVRAVLGLVGVDAGELRWNGRHVPSPAEFMVPPRAAYTPQAPALLSGRLQDSLLMGADRVPGLHGAVEAAVFGRDLAALPEGLGTVIGPMGVRLSGGQAQRAAIARMLAHPAELLVLDDVTSSLDAGTEAELWARLLALDRTVLAVSHSRRLLSRADQILILDRGRIVARGDARELHQHLVELEERRSRGLRT